DHRRRAGKPPARGAIRGRRAEPRLARGKRCRVRRAREVARREAKSRLLLRRERRGWAERRTAMVARGHVESPAALLGDEERAAAQDRRDSRLRYRRGGGGGRAWRWFGELSARVGRGARWEPWRLEPDRAVKPPETHKILATTYFPERLPSQ